AILSDATERAFLENLEVDKFDCFIISTGVDSHAAILITLYLSELGAKRIIVKANSSDHAKILRKVGASETIIPEEQMAVRLAHSIAQSNLLDYLPLTGDYIVAELSPPEKFVGKSLMDLQLRVNYNLSVIAVKDVESGNFDFAPGGDYIVRAGDILVTLGKHEDIDKIKL
ncbi:MAG: TrkA family potassium uptake protein, partial [FCB group bacterium]|nr:TrkA family potassium uptake protein [FCB group bacterium]